MESDNDIDNAEVKNKIKNRFYKQDGISCFHEV